MSKTEKARVRRQSRWTKQCLRLSAGFISHAATGFVGGASLDVVTAYFNVGGYALLADSLDQVTGVRLLLGAEPSPPENPRRALRSESVHPQRAAHSRLRRALDSHEQNLVIERDHLGFTQESEYRNSPFGGVASVRDGPGTPA